MVVHARSFDGWCIVESRVGTSIVQKTGLILNDKWFLMIDMWSCMDVSKYEFHMDDRLHNGTMELLRIIVMNLMIIVPRRPLFRK